jgi:hypothetical protein
LLAVLLALATTGCGGDDGWRCVDPKLIPGWIITPGGGMPVFNRECAGGWRCEPGMPCSR